MCSIFGGTHWELINSTEISGGDIVYEYLRDDVPHTQVVIEGANLSTAINEEKEVGTTATYVVEAESGYALPSAITEVKGIDLSDITYNSSTGSLSFVVPDEDCTITIDCVAI